MIDVTLLGTGGMMPLPGRFLTSCMLQINGHSILIDCGESTQTAIRSAGLSFKPIDLICITHFHADHISGLVGVLLSMANSERKEPVTILAPPKAAQVIGHMLVIAPQFPFELYVSELKNDVLPFDFEGIQITPFPVKHRVPCWGFSFYLPRLAKFDPDAAESLGVPRILWSRLQSGADVELDDGRLIRARQVTGKERRGIRVTYATDTRPVPVISEVGRDSDLMILEGMYGNDEKMDKAMHDGHMIFEEAAGIARDAGAKQLWLTHYSPALPDPEAYLDAARAVFPETVCGTCGMHTLLRYPEDGR